MGLMKFSAARRDYEAVLKLRPKDPDATKKYKEADKIVKRLAFEKAIAVDDGSKPLVEELRAKVDDIAVEDAYDGPRLEGDITLEVRCHPHPLPCGRLLLGQPPFGPAPCNHLWLSEPHCSGARSLCKR